MDELQPGASFLYLLYYDWEQIPRARRRMLQVGQLNGRFRIPPCAILAD
jgi:hypothetical protein